LRLLKLFQQQQQQDHHHSYLRSTSWSISE
jgi:hypothetical protein